MIFNQSGNLKNQSGVTLLLSILVLAAILAISFSIATILFVEVRTSGDLLRSESSYYGSQALSEEALFKTKRQAGLNYERQLGNVDLSSPVPTETQITDPIFKDRVDSTSSTFANTKNRYALFDTTNLNNTSSGYGKITITRLPSGAADAGRGGGDPLYIYVCQYNPTLPSDQFDPVGEPCSDAVYHHSSGSTGNGYWNSPDTGSNDPNCNLNCFSLLAQQGQQSWSLDSHSQQQIIIVNPNGVNPINITIQAFDSSGTVPLGIPYSGKTAVKIAGNVGGVTRKITTIIPNQVSAGCTVTTGGGNTATFLGTDTTTHGDWVTAGYGKDGYNVINNIAPDNNGNPHYPPYVSIDRKNDTNIREPIYQWQPGNNIGNALYSDNSSGVRVYPEQTWWDWNQFFINLNFTDTNVHKVSVYMIDWDNFPNPNGRIAAVDVLDSNGNKLVNTQIVSSYQNGVYLSWNLSGHVTLLFTSQIPGNQVSNVVMSGIFFDPAGGASGCSAPPGKITVIKNVDSGSDSFSFTTGASNIPPSFASFNIFSNVNDNSANKVFTNLPQGTYKITETAKAGWKLNTASCINSPNSSFDGNQSINNIIIDSTHTDITCTFNNTNTGSSSGYKVLKTINVKPSQVAGNGTLVGFPVLVCFNGPAPCNQSLGLVGNVNDPNGNDIIFASDVNGTLLPFEKEKYVAGTGEAVFWVKVNLTGGSGATFYMLYGNPNINTFQGNLASGGVWNSNYQGVWHLGNGTSISTVDSSTSGNNGTIAGSPSAIAGWVNGAANFSGSNDFMQINTISYSGKDYVISAWFKTPLPTANYWATLARGSSSDHQVLVRMGLDGHVGAYCNNCSSTSFNDSNFSVFSLANGWHYLVAVATGGNTKFYIDGGYKGTGSTQSVYDTTYLGNYQGGNQQFGQTDEIRISTAASGSNINQSTPDWIQTEYNNQSAPASFYTVN